MSEASSIALAVRATFAWLANCHPVSDLAIERLLPVSEKGKGAIERLDRSQGREREIAVLFADLRSFTRFFRRTLTV